MEQFSLNDPALKPLAEKVRANERLSFEDGMTLLESPDLFGVAQLANYRREELNGKNTYFIQNAHLNPTNICENTCRFCAFKSKEGEEDAYRMSISDVLEKAEEQYYEEMQEFHIVGGLDPRCDLDYYEELFHKLKEKFPEVHIKALTAVEVDFLAKKTGLSLEKTLQRLINKGLGSLPGGGAEILDDEVRKKICPDKISGDRWLEVMGAAHFVGLKTNATMLYGHMEKNEHRVSHFIKLREQQDASGGFQAFIPLAFHPINTEIEGLSNTSASLDLRIISVARLMLDNFPHVKAYWTMISLPMAQLSQFYGADDIDGTIQEERITHAAGAETPMAVGKNTLKRLIKEAGYTPVERDTIYNPLTTKPAETH